MLGSVTSPNRPENRSMWYTPGKVLLVKSGKSSMVISPYFFFMASICALGRVPGVLKMSRMGQVLEAIRSSFSFSVRTPAAGFA
jgi:hypothetical protein